jgi:hypothetical protein
MTGKGNMKMAENDDDAYAKICKEDLEYSGPPHPDERFISYRLDPEERPGKLNVRFVVRVVSGDRAKHIDADQAAAITDLLKWVREHREQQEHDQQGPAAPGRRPARPAPKPPVNASDK